MGEHLLSLVVTIVFFVFMAYLIYRGRQRRAFSRGQMNPAQSAGSNNRPNQVNAKEAMAAFKLHLEQLQSLVQAQEGTTHEPQAHVVEMLSATYAQLIDLDKRIKVFEREAEAFKKSHVGLENP